MKSTIWVLIIIMLLCLMFPSCGSSTDNDIYRAPTEAELRQRQEDMIRYRGLLY